ncbi:tetratricopeptide repeat protein [Streptomyces sp. NPDC051453]|uniref:ATP-binding protein n=1 Tax=Streptomyces sp. NPDC051453 TaxID=3154941 RepID=UPI003442A7EE
MGDHSERFWAELNAVYEAAERPTLDRLVHLGRRQQPPMTVSKSTINDWLGSKSVPGTKHTAYFLVLAAFLQARAKQVGQGYTARPRGFWQQLLTRAQTERSAARGGRPITVKAPLPPMGPVTLPPPASGFTGRTELLEEIMDRLDPDRAQTEAAVVISAVGMGGVGKTALALQAAHQARERRWFPGGILFADLRGYSPGTELDVANVTDQFLRALGTKAKDLPPTPQEKQDAWHLLLNVLAAQGRPLLTVLDNVRTPGQVSALLPPPPHRALVTSCQTLSTLPALQIALDPLHPTEAVALLDEALRVGGSSDERVSTQPAAARRLAELCGYLPLALRITAALLRDEPERPLADQADELEDARTRLDALKYDGDDSQGRPLAVRATFELSYRHLTEPQAMAFRLLAATPGPDISTAAAAVLLDRPDSRRLLADLARAHLLQPAPSERWAMHDLVHLFADDHGRAHAEADRRDMAVTRLLDYYLAMARAGDSHLDATPDVPPSDVFSGRDAALAWLDRECATLLTAAVAPSARHHPAGVQLSAAIANFLSERRRFADLLGITTAAINVLRETNDRYQEGQALDNLGYSLTEVRRFDEAIDAHRAAIEIFHEAGDRHQECRALNHLGFVLTQMRRFGEAIDAHTTAAKIFHEAGDSHSEAEALDHLGVVLSEVGRFDEAIKAHTTAIGVFRQTRGHNRHTEGKALNNLGFTLQRMGRFEEAIDAHRQDLMICRVIGDLHGEAKAQGNVGSALAQLRRFDEAIDAHSTAIDIFRRAGDLHAEGVMLSNLGSDLQRVGRFDEAIEVHRAAVLILREAGDPYREAVARNNWTIAHNERWQNEASKPPSNYRKPGSHLGHTT